MLWMAAVVVVVVVGLLFLGAGGPWRKAVPGAVLVKAAWHRN
jgi:uncharacterized protein YjeT (DUF2065 family)